MQINLKTDKMNTLKLITALDYVTRYPYFPEIYIDVFRKNGQ